MNEPLDDNWKKLGDAASRVVQHLATKREPFRLYTHDELRALYPVKQPEAAE